MSFSAATCLTSLGTANVKDPIFIYSDVDDYAVPFTSTTLSLITGSSCPYIVRNIPTGSEFLKFVSDNGYCAEVQIFPNDLCLLFKLELENYFPQSNTQGKVVAGNLKSGPSNVISEYLIYWYGPNTIGNPKSRQTLAFTSGKGSVFEPYDITHPFLGQNGKTVTPGVYFPVIQKVILNDIKFSISGGTGFVPSKINCLEPTIVS